MLILFRIRLAIKRLQKRQEFFRSDDVLFFQLLESVLLLLQNCIKTMTIQLASDAAVVLIVYGWLLAAVGIISCA
jgi:uncharacterized membrane protein